MSSGDFSAGTLSAGGVGASCSASSFVPLGILGTGDSDLASLAVEELDALRFVKDLDRRSDVEVGRGVMSEASSKVS